MNFRIFFSLVVILQPSLLLAEKLPISAPEPEATGAVTVERAWVETPREDAIMLPAFATLKSNASEQWVLQRVTARYFRAAMIHRTILQDGEPRMVLQSSLTVRPGETTVMTKQGYHLMFIGPKKKFKQGDNIKVVFYFDNKTPIKINFPLLKKAPK